MSAEAEVEMLGKLFESLGSNPSQALAMARQVSKRASQLCEERGVARTEAMRYLVELVTKGNSGDCFDSFLGKSKS